MLELIVFWLIIIVISKKKTSKAPAIQSSPLIITSIQMMTDIAVNRQLLSYLLS
jgi:hypothetical protein